MSFKINTAVTGLTFNLRALADGSDVTTGTTAGFFTIDGGTQGSIAGAFTHEGNGQWSVNLTAAEMNGSVIGLVFTNSLAMTVGYTIKTVLQLNSDQNNFDPATNAVANVTLVATTTTNTDMVAAAPTVVQVRQEMDTNSTQFAQIIIDIATRMAESSISTTGGAVDTVTNITNNVNALVQGYLNTVMTEVTAGRIAGNFGVFYRNADALTAQTVDDVGGGGGGGTDWTAGERNEIRGRLGITGTTAAGGNTPTLSLETTVNTVKADTAATLLDTANMQPKLGTPSTTISGDIATRMAEASINTTAGVIDRVALVDVTTLNSDMRGTDGVTAAPTAVQNRQEMDTNSVDLNQIVSDVAGLAGAAMRGTDGANTTVPDPAGTANTVAPDNATIALIRTDTLTTIPALLNDIAITKNQPGILHIQMVQSTDGRTPLIGATVTGQRLIDSGTYVNMGATITEVSNGTYSVAYLAADSNGNMLTWKFSAIGGDDTFVTILTVA